ncbi:MAG TPA: hypothetical protein VF003_10685, partial [Pseudonocardiaceae bacterium]
VVIASALASRLVARIGAPPLILTGAAAVAGGMLWFSRLSEHAGYVGQLLGPMLVTSAGLGLGGWCRMGSAWFGSMRRG